MASPFLGHRQRLARHSSAATPLRGSPLARSSSTPYDLVHAQHDPGMRMGSGSRLANGTAFATPRSTNAGSVFASPSSPNTYGAAYRRNVGFGSPGAAATRASPRPSQGMERTLPHAQQQHAIQEESLQSTNRVRPRVSNRFVRRKSIKQRLMEAPGDLYDRLLFSEYLDFGNPALGYPLGVAMHILSISCLIIHPEGTLRFTSSKQKQARQNSLFADQGPGGLAARRRTQKEYAWRWMANGLALLLLLVAIANAVHFFAARRRYHLWLKSSAEAIPSENASLVDIPTDVDSTQERTISAKMVQTFKSIIRRIWRMMWWTTKKVLWRMRSLSYIGIVIRILFPIFSRINTARQARNSTVSHQMHAIDVWEAPEVPLRIFCLYSPLHALVYLANMNALPLFRLHVAGSAGSRISSFIASVLLMTVFSAQTILIVHLYSGLVKDKSIIAGEVLHEYDQKFVMPRAMPACRDASTMTSQAEMIDMNEWAESSFEQPSPRSKKEAMATKQHHRDFEQQAPGFDRLSSLADGATQAYRPASRTSSTVRKKSRKTTGV